MASPWKFLARLTLGRREQADQKGAADDVKSEPAVIAETVEPAPEKASDAADRRTDAHAQPADHADAVPAKPHHADAEEANSTVAVATDDESVKRAEIGGLSLPGDNDAAFRAVAGVRTPLQLRQSAPRTRSKKSSNAVAAVPRRLPPRAPTFSDEVVGLDEEIRLLRDQLARKLQHQNAQLRKMLERFER